MPSGLYTWSQTAATNATADSSINWAEGQSPSSLNDSARAMMSGLAKYRDDIAGSIGTGGTATAYTITSNSNFDTLAHLNGQLIAFVPNATNTNTVGNDVTLNVDSLGAKPIRMQPSVALPGGTLVLGTPYVVTYNNADAVFYLQNMTNPYSIPLGSSIEYWGSTAPNSSFVLPTGQALSRTTYATLFTLFGTTYGSGDGSTTFNVPDMTGRVIVMKEASATRLTSTYFGGNSTVLGATGGLESQTLSLGQLPTGITSTGSLSASLGNLVGTASPGSFSVDVGGLNAGSRSYPSLTAGTWTINTSASVSGTITSNNTSGNPHNIVQPTIISNRILRVI